MCFGGAEKQNAKRGLASRTPTKRDASSMLTCLQRPVINGIGEHVGREQ